MSQATKWLLVKKSRNLRPKLEQNVGKAGETCQCICGLFQHAEYLDQLLTSTTLIVIGEDELKYAADGDQLRKCLLCVCCLHKIAGPTIARSNFDGDHV